MKGGAEALFYKVLNKVGYWCRLYKFPAIFFLWLFHNNHNSDYDTIKVHTHRFFAQPCRNTGLYYPAYNERRSLTSNGTSTRCFSRFRIIAAASSPIFRKSVDMVVIPSRMNRFQGVSL